MFFNIIATFAEFEADLIRMRTREGMAIAKAKGKLRGKQPKLSEKQQKELWRMHDQRSCRGLLRVAADCLSNFEKATNRLAYDSAPYRNRPAVADCTNITVGYNSRPIVLQQFTFCKKPYRGVAIGTKG